MNTEYAEPDTTTEDKDYTGAARTVQRGDKVDGSVVGNIKVGTKWTDITDTRGLRLMRVENDQHVTVTRTRETQASCDAAMRADTNRMLVRALEERDQDGSAVLAAFNSHVTSGWGITYYNVADMIEADAKREIWKHYAQIVAYTDRVNDESDDQFNPEHELFGADHVDCFDALIVSLTDMILGSRVGGNSRSTNQMANLMEDIKLDTIRDFVRNKHRFGRF